MVARFFSSFLQFGDNVVLVVFQICVFPNDLWPSCAESPRSVYLVNLAPRKDANSPETSFTKSISLKEHI